MFGAVKLAKNAYPDKYKYSFCGTGFNARGFFSFSDGSGFGKIFGSDMRSLMHIDNQKKDLLILVYGSADDLDDTALSKDKEYSILYWTTKEKLCLSLHYNGVNSYIFVKSVEAYKLKAKDSETNATPLCLSYWVLVDL